MFEKWEMPIRVSRVQYLKKKKEVKSSRLVFPIDDVLIPRLQHRGEMLWEYSEIKAMLTREKIISFYESRTGEDRFEDQTIAVIYTYTRYIRHDENNIQTSLEWLLNIYDSMFVPTSRRKDEKNAKVMNFALLVDHVDRRREISTLGSDAIL